MKVLRHKIELLTGLLLQEMTMAGLHELRFTEEKPLLPGQDAELDNSDAFLAAVDTDWKVGPYGVTWRWAGDKKPLGKLDSCFQ
uniref:Uncharacterized protein n=1 Tax=Nothoprocta perdicaria TaxID=30464 RepID=A0A8C6ZBJ1_NOTPE